MPAFSHTASAYQSVTVEENLKSSLIGKLDMMIAAVGLVHNLPILTCDNDLRGFKDCRRLLLRIIQTKLFEFLVKHYCSLF